MPAALLVRGRFARLRSTTLRGEVGGGYKGTVFSINPSTGAEKVLFLLQQIGRADGEEPAASLIAVKARSMGLQQLAARTATGRCSSSRRSARRVFELLAA